MLTRIRLEAKAGTAAEVEQQLASAADAVRASDVASPQWACPDGIVLLEAKDGYWGRVTLERNGG